MEGSKGKTVLLVDFVDKFFLQGEIAIDKNNFDYLLQVLKIFVRNKNTDGELI